jgi:hypothetical protein
MRNNLKTVNDCQERGLRGNLKYNENMRIETNQRTIQLRGIGFRATTVLFLTIPNNRQRFRTTTTLFLVMPNDRQRTPNTMSISLRISSVK